MLNNMTPFQSTVVEQYIKERNKRAKEIAQKFSAKQFGQSPPKDTQSGLGGAVGYLRQ